MMRSLRSWAVAALALFCWGFAPQAQATSRFEDTPRIAIISAFQPEIKLLMEALQQAHSFSKNGVDFTTGTLEGKPVVLFLSGISMTNAAMNTQLALDHFNITHIVFSGIAGGVNPALRIGDVAVVERWGQYLEVSMARELEPGVYRKIADKNHLDMPGFGMLSPRRVKVRSAGHPEPEAKFWFDVDPQMLGAARTLGAVQLASCDDRGACLRHPPQVVIGGNGVSGSAFVDNAEFRKYVYENFHASVLDMESAACAMVAYSNGVPFIAFRSLSDLAGGGEGENEMQTFLNLAATNSARVLLAFLKAWH